MNEITNKRQIRRLVVLPYDLEVKAVSPESIAVIAEFAKKTGDYPSLSATDIKVMALTYQLEKEQVGTDHLRMEPIVRRQVNVVTKTAESPNMDVGLAGFYMPGKKDNWVAPSVPTSRTTSVCTDTGNDEEKNTIAGDETEKDEKVETIDNMTTKDNTSETNDNLTESNDNLSDTDNNEEEQFHDTYEDLSEKFGKLDCNNEDNIVRKDEEDLMNDILTAIKETEDDLNEVLFEDEEDAEEFDEDAGWITPSNVKLAKKQIGSKFVEEKHVKVACMTTDFAMQNVLKQMNLNVAALDGRLISQLRTFILRCYTCFKTTSLMEKTFCPSCGNQTLKRVAVSLDENGKQVIHINGRRPLTARGKKYSLPKFQGGKHANNPILVADQPVPDNRPSRLARTKINAMEHDYIPGYSPFIMRDATSKSAMLGIKPKDGVKHWMKKNPNEARRRRK